MLHKLVCEIRNLHTRQIIVVIQKPIMNRQKTSFLRHPSLQYLLIMLLGSYGVYISMPIDLHPQSTVETLDLIINLIIFVPCSLIALIGGLLAIYCAVLSDRIDENGRFTKFATIVLKNFGLHKFLLSEFIFLGPLNLFAKTFRSLFKKQRIKNPW